MIKGRLYTCASNSTERRGAQTAIYEILNVLVRVMAPILVFTAEEIWQSMPKEKRDVLVSSVHLLGWPEANPGFAGDGPRILETLVPLIPEVAKLLEEERGRGIIAVPLTPK